MFGEMLAWLHRHNRLAVTSTMLLTFVGVVQMIA